MSSSYPRKLAITGIVLTLTFFLSGFFVLLTPLPLIYQFLKRKGRVFVDVVAPCLALLGLLYFFGVGPLRALYQEYPYLSWLLPVPAMNLLPTYSVTMVAVSGLLNFLFFVAVAFLVATVFNRQSQQQLQQQITCLIGGGALFFFGITVALLFCYAAFKHQSLLTLLHAYYQEAAQNYFLLSVGNGNADLPADKLAYLKENLPALVNYLVLFSPSLLYVMFLFILVLNLILGRQFLSPLVPSLKTFSLNRWDLNFGWVWVVIGLVALWLANSIVWHISLILAVSVNGLIVLFFVYFLKGLSLIAFFMEQKKVGSFMRFGVYALIFILFQTLGCLVTGFGFFDSWFDFRGKLKGKVNKL